MDHLYLCFTHIQLFVTEDYMYRGYNETVAFIEPDGNFVMTYTEDKVEKPDVSWKAQLKQKPVLMPGSH